MKNGPYELVIAPPEYPGKRYRGRYCYKHHLVWWKHTGELPGKGELIHHRNENKMDNRFGNLKKEVKSDHTRHHHVKPVMTVLECLHCHNNFEIRLRIAKRRMKQQQKIRGKYEGLYCSHSCQATDQQAKRRT